MKGDLEIPPFRPKFLGSLQCIARRSDDDPCAGTIGKACSAWATRLIWGLEPEYLQHDDLTTIIRLLICNRHNDSTLKKQWDDLVKSYAPQIKSFIAADDPNFSLQHRRCDRNSRQDFRRKLGQVIKNNQFATGYLYIYNCPYIPGFVKIGCSAHAPSRRIKEWRSCYPLATEQYSCEIDFPQRMEELVHLKLATLRSEIICLAQQCDHDYHNEWFECSVEDAKVAIEHLKALNDGNALYDRESRGLSSYWVCNVVDLEDCMTSNSGGCNHDAEISDMLHDFSQVQIEAEVDIMTEEVDVFDQEASQPNITKVSLANPN